MSESFDRFFIAISSAEGYFRAAKMIRSQFIDGFEFLIKFSSAYEINMAFACELYMKGLLSYREISFSHKGIAGHDLCKLYEKLHPDDRLIIEKSYHATPPIKDFLNEHRTIFLDYRYPYEDNPNREMNLLYFRPLESLTEALSTVCVLRYDQNMNTEEPADAD